jgi:hypothetical protein
METNNPASNQPQTGVTLVLHEGTPFQDATIHLSGHAYFNCVFTRCTMVYNGGPCHLEGCSMNSCSLHLNVTIYDSNSLEAIRTMLANLEVMFLKTGSGVTAAPSSGVVSWDFSSATDLSQNSPE